MFEEGMTSQRAAQLAYGQSAALGNEVQQRDMPCIDAGFSHASDVRGAQAQCSGDVLGTCYLPNASTTSAPPVVRGCGIRPATAREECETSRKVNLH
jgi:hypothetical protein